METLTHAFLTCGEVAPVIDWLVSTWQALSGTAVPRTPEVLLADDPRAWPGGPAEDSAAYRLWTRLRVATLGAIWQTRCTRGSLGVRSFASVAAGLAMDTVVGALRRDWLRTQRDVREMDSGGFCRDWWRGFDVRLTEEDFIDQWAAPPFLCRVQQQAGRRSQLVVLLSGGAPVALPA